MALLGNTFNVVKTFITKEIRMFNAGESANINKAPYLYDWFWTTKLGKPRGIDFIELRQYAKSGWVQMVTNAILKQVMSTEWNIKGRNDDIDIEKYQSDVDKGTDFLNHPNRNGDSFWELWVPWLRDVLEIDAGVMWKGRNGQGELAELFTYEGSRFLFNITNHGIIEGYYQYSYMHPDQQPLPFEKDEIVYGKMNLSTELFPYGFSPLQSIQQEVELMIQSTRWNKEMYKNNPIPDGIVSAKMDPAQLDRLRAGWEQNVKGKAHKLAFVNSDKIDFKQLTLTNKDMEWLDGQKWYFHIVFGAYGLSPAEVGFYEDVNRSAQEGQERVTVKNAVKPYLKLIQDKINNEILPELLGHTDLIFDWNTEDDGREKEKHDQTIQKLQSNVYTINEVRAMEGLDPVEWGDKPMSMNMQERSAEMFNDKEESNNKEEPEGEEKKETKLYNKLFERYMRNGKQ